MKLKIINFATHRNGIGGAPFHVLVFREPFVEFCGTARMHFEEEAKSYRKGD